MDIRITTGESNDAPVDELAAKILRGNLVGVRMNPRAGFTIIELSIVLVIIGLFVGGVFVGQDMMLAAQRCDALADWEETPK